MNIDIATTIRVILLLLGIAAIASLIMAFRSIRAGQKLQFFQKRQVLISHGWRLVLLTGIIIVGGFLLLKFGEPVAYRYFPPSPTTTRTPTITITPTITLTPVNTYTPTITLTLAQTYTPGLPEQIQATIQTPVGVDNNAIFSPITFSTKIENGLVVDPQASFDPPITVMYGGFSYDKMSPGVQWSVVWLFNNEIICSETRAWTWTTGGYGFSDCSRDAGQWLPGDYEVQIFVGQTWKTSGRFLIRGESESGTPAPQAVTDTPTVTPSLSPP